MAVNNDTTPDNLETPLAGHGKQSHGCIDGSVHPLVSSQGAHTDKCSRMERMKLPGKGGTIAHKEIIEISCGLKVRQQ